MDRNMATYMEITDFIGVCRMHLRFRRRLFTGCFGFLAA